MIRKFRTEDFDKCVEIVNDVWDFDGRFHPAQLSNLFKRVYVGGSLSASNFAIVVVKDIAVKGFLFGKCGSKNLLRSEFSGFKGSLHFLLQLLFVKGVGLKKKFFYLNMMAEHEKNRRKVEPTRENEVNLFAVTPKTQGKGYGRLLMSAFIDYCKSQNINRITLDTDKECNYGFYEHFGFNVKGEFYSPLQKEYSGKSGDSYVYELIIDDTAERSA